MGKTDKRRPEAVSGSYEDNYNRIFGEGAFYRDDAPTQHANIDALDALDAAELNVGTSEEAAPGTPVTPPALEGGEAEPADLTD